MSFPAARYWSLGSPIAPTKTARFQNPASNSTLPPSSVPEAGWPMVPCTKKSPPVQLPPPPPMTELVMANSPADPHKGRATSKPIKPASRFEAKPYRCALSHREKLTSVCSLTGISVAPPHRNFSSRQKIDGTATVQRDAGSLS